MDIKIKNIDKIDNEVILNMVLPHIYEMIKQSDFKEVLGNKKCSFFDIIGERGTISINICKNKTCYSVYISKFINKV